MMFKQYFSLVVLSFSCAALAATPDNKSVEKITHHARASVSLLGDFLYSDLTGTLKPVGGTHEPYTSDDGDLNIGGEIALGYQWGFLDHRHHTDYQILLEAYLQGDNSKIEPDYFTLESFQSVHMEFDYVYGLRIRPGIHITPSAIFFVDLGAARGKLVAHSDPLALPNAPISYAPISFSKEIWGVRYGVGFEYQMTHTLSFAITGAVTTFESQDLKLVDTLGNLEVTKLKTEPILYSTGLSLSYHFR